MKRIVTKLAITGWAVLMMVGLGVWSCSTDRPTPETAQQVVEKLNQTYFFDSRVWKQDIQASVADNIVTLTGETFYPQAVRGAIRNLKSAGFDSIVSQVNFLPEMLPDGKNFAIVTVHHVMGRYKPVAKKQEATELIYGDLVRIIRQVDDQYQVQSPEGYLAYIPTNTLRRLDTLTWNRYHQGPFAKFGQNIPLKNGASISIGSRLPYLGNGVVLLADGQEYEPNANVDYRVFSPGKNPLRQEILAAGKKYLGLPYVWGGRSGEGADCSGFTQGAFSLNGIYLPRDTDEMSITGQFIGFPGWYDALLPGDLVFYTSGRRLITHVAIYYGDGKVIQSSDSGVHIASMDPKSPDYEERLLRDFTFAKRVID
ncbi:MAG: C40 family peptidase [Lentisphaeria bacterium]|nr:C40 family peptidase [Candidatus Neomarinimicrobiota bacterium]MCF7841276.1 C40 family peptidase [Lentisphaeria bacterium]